MLVSELFSAVAGQGIPSLRHAIALRLIEYDLAHYIFRKKRHVSVLGFVQTLLESGVNRTEKWHNELSS